MLSQRAIASRHVTNSATRALLRARRAASSRVPMPPVGKRAPALPEQSVKKENVPTSPATTRSLPLYRRIPLYGALFTAAIIAFYGVQITLIAQKPCHNLAVADLSQQKDVAGRYDDTADDFDAEVGFSEVAMGINKIRKKLAKQCKGHVLEVSCGTGRNLGYYDLSQASKVESLSFNDLSPQMVNVCKRKWFALVETPGANKKDGMPVRFMTGSALKIMPLAPGGLKYDTIFQTMGLCSTATPVELLANMVKHLNMDNPEARILLLEHGRSYKPWLNNILDNAAEKHAEIHGCWFNRDIGDLVQNAAEQTGLEVVKERRHHLGTTWVFELKPKAGFVAKAATDIENVPQDEQKKASWFSWLPSSWTSTLNG